MRTMPGGSLTVPALLLAALFLPACSTAVFTDPFALVGPDGKHPAGWVAGHPSFAGSAGDPCFPCHGGDLLGGISGVSCFTSAAGAQPCHPYGPAFHPAGWLDKALRHTPQFHATAFSLGVTVGGAGCSACHTPPALDDAGGYCRRCHFDISGRRTPLSGPSYSHGAITGHNVFTAPTSDVCVACHETDRRFGHPPFCHDCHEPFPTAHPAGWAAAGQHGAAAKRAPSTTGGFPFCQSCHGDDLAGGIAGRSCLSTTTCHAAAPGRPHTGPGFWGGHTGTNPGNAIVCVNCHRHASGAAGCFNNTLCHGAKD
jgi:hypothetical protein